MSFRGALELDIYGHMFYDKAKGECSCGAALGKNPSPVLRAQHLADSLLDGLISKHAAQAYEEGFDMAAQYSDGRGPKPRLVDNPYRIGE